VTRSGTCFLAASHLTEGVRLLANEVVPHLNGAPAALVFQLGRWAGRADHRADQVRDVAHAIDERNAKRRERRKARRA
jgi:hypothetical protein